MSTVIVGILSSYWTHPCGDAETVLRVLQQPSRRERWCLGNVRYYDDVTVTHEDEAYMQKYYDVDPKRGDQYYVYTRPGPPIHRAVQLFPAQPLRRYAVMLSAR